MSTVVWDDDKVVLPINEPAEGRRKSQIEEYLDFYGSPGVQHIALRTDDIVAAGAGAARPRRAVHGRAADATTTRPASGWHGVDLPWDGARRARHPRRPRPRRATCCRSSPRPLTDRPTVFFEIIQREGATGFGEGNFKALFESIEREQARRGNL